MPFYSFERRHHTWDVIDEDGEVASFGWDNERRLWWVCADTERFATNDSLPPVFGRHFHHRIDHLGDVYRMFDVPLPGFADHRVMAAAE